MKKNWPFHLGFFLLIVSLIIYKSAHLNIPFFWDESWVYGPALQIMAEGGPGLLPSALNDWFSRGHPLMFHFIGSSWIVLFGDTLSAIHSFPLSVSVLFLLTIYLATGSTFGWFAGFSSALLMAVQPMFIAQSSLVLPEIFLALFSFLAIFFIVKKWYILSGIAGIFAVLTKESGLIIMGLLVIFCVFDGMIRRKSISRKEIRNSIIGLSLPFLFFVLFLVIQYFQKGWLFYPEHIGMIEWESSIFWNKMGIFYEVMFIKYGNLVISLILVISALAMLLARQQVPREMKRLLFLGLLLLAGFSVFSSLNFFTNRYLLPVFPLFLIPAGYFLTAAKRPVWMKSIILGAIAFYLLFINLVPQNLRIGDTSMGYLDGVKVHQESIDFLVDLDIRDERVLTHFLMNVQLTQSTSRYLEADEKFTQVTTTWDDSVRWIVYSNFERNFDLEQIKQEQSLELIRRFESGKAYTEIYHVKPQ